MKEIDKLPKSPWLPWSIIRLFSAQNFRLGLESSTCFFKIRICFFRYRYVCFQSELSQVENATIDTKTQYRWYQVCYQVGVFISRSSLHIIRVPNLWILVFLQVKYYIILISKSLFLKYKISWLKKRDEVSVALCHSMCWNLSRNFCYVASFFLVGLLSVAVV